MKSFGELYASAYGLICGTPPTVRPWHFQWLSRRSLVSDLQQVLRQLQGRVLDVGCGHKPYALWLNPRDTELVGIDVTTDSQADLIVSEQQQWPFDRSSFDAVICTQVLEHIPDLDHTLSEIDRVLKTGGWLIASAPFLYNVHGESGDYRRLALQGMRNLFEEKYDVLSIDGCGGVGTAMGMLWLNWIEISTNRWKVTRFLKGLLLPFWLLMSFGTNAAGLLLDKLDRTMCFYTNVLLVARKR